MWILQSTHDIEAHLLTQQWDLCSQTNGIFWKVSLKVCTCTKILHVLSICTFFIKHIDIWNLRAQYSGTSITKQSSFLLKSRITGSQRDLRDRWVCTLLLKRMYDLAPSSCLTFMPSMAALLRKTYADACYLGQKGKTRSLGPGITKTWLEIRKRRNLYRDNCLKTMTDLRQRSMGP